MYLTCPHALEAKNRSDKKIFLRVINFKISLEQNRRQIL